MSIELALSLALASSPRPQAGEIAPASAFEKGYRHFQLGATAYRTWNHLYALRCFAEARLEFCAIAADQPSAVELMAEAWLWDALIYKHLAAGNRNSPYFREMKNAVDAAERWVRECGISGRLQLWRMAVRLMSPCWSGEIGSARHYYNRAYLELYDPNKGRRGSQPTADVYYNSISYFRNMLQQIEHLQQ